MEGRVYINQLPINSPNSLKNSDLCLRALQYNNSLPFSNPNNVIESKNKIN